MVCRVVLVTILLAVAAGTGCKRTLKNLDKCRAGGFEISDCEVGDGDPSPEMRKRCTKMLQRAKKCGGYQCESAGNGDDWHEVVWPDSPSGIDDEATEHLEVVGEPVAVNVSAGEDVVFTIRMNPVPGNPYQDVELYLLQRVESLDAEDTVLGTATFLYHRVSLRGILDMGTFLLTDDYSGCYIKPHNDADMSDVLNLTDLTGYTVTMDMFGHYTAKGVGVDTAYSFAEHPDVSCFWDEAEEATKARVYFMTMTIRKYNFIGDFIKIEWKAEVITYT